METMKDEFDLLRQYLHEYIDRMKPITTDYQIEVYRQHGYIEGGHNCNNFIPFDIWKQLNNQYVQR